MRFSLVHNPAPSMFTPSTVIWVWDGNDLLASCEFGQQYNGQTQCGVPAFSVEGLATYSPATNYLLVEDRNNAGSVVMSHDATGFSGWSEPPRAQSSQTKLVAVGPCSVSQDVGGAICPPQTGGKLSSDGWTLYGEVWQGIRTYDPSVGQWNTPDAYAGDVHDPMSQKPFIWNHNNPYEYTDPSGYVPEWDQGWDNAWNAQHFSDAFNASATLERITADFIFNAFDASINNAVYDNRISTNDRNIMDYIASYTSFSQSPNGSVLVQMFGVNGQSWFSTKTDPNGAPDNSVRVRVSGTRTGKYKDYRYTTVNKRLIRSDPDGKNPAVMPWYTLELIKAILEPI